jgi:uncharacterized SAM-binding protein YcdF (DUF218 family)
MFFVLSKTLRFLISPLPLLVLALLGVVTWYHRKWARAALLVVLVCLYALSIPFTADRLMHWLEVPRVSRHALQSHYDVVVVLSGMVNLQLSREGHLEFTDAVDRILAGIAFVKQGIGHVLLISGGSEDLFDQSRSEAPLLRDFALQLGLATAQVLIEPNSRNTYENARFSARLLRAHDYQRVLLITSAAHMRRAVAAFHKQGIFPDTYPVDFEANDVITLFSFIPSARSLSRTTDAIHELVGLVMYRLQGYIYTSRGFR